ncbi:MAG: hypothetical protein MR352_09125 [Ruminococcus sp.]|nr:hypothetical protein [Ruminococcus sp.]MCI5618214.1 hypothetical protein [Ruminococcus sp.]
MKKEKYVSKHCGNVSHSFKGISYSYISLFLVVMVLIGSTVSWFTIKDNANINSNIMNFNSGTGLRVNDGEDITNHIKVDNFNIDEASSVDGRNLFFPNNNVDGDNNLTYSLQYRDATVGDKNQRFLYKDFTVSADSKETNVYVKSYTIKVGDETFNGSTQILFNDSSNPLKPTGIVTHDTCPIRIAFITDSQDKPTVFDPTALVDRYAKTYPAISSTSLDTGSVINTENSTSISFSDYYYAVGKPIFTLEGTTPKKVTMVAWLEGTGDNCDKYAGKKLSIDIELESNFKDMEWITFVDDTVGDANTSVKHWINSANDSLITMTYKDITTTGSPYRTVIMKDNGEDAKGNPTWVAPIPEKVVTDITFNRYSLNDEMIYNAWYTRDKVEEMWANKLTGDSAKRKTHELQESREINGTRKTVYTALGGNGYGKTEDISQRLSPCLGYWDYENISSGGSGSGGSGSGGEIIEDPNAKIKIGIDFNITTNNKNWIKDDINYHGYKMYAKFIDGTLVPMKLDNDVCKINDYEMKVNSILTAFVLKSESDTKTIKINQNVIFNRSMNITMEISNDDVAHRTN